MEHITEFPAASIWRPPVRKEKLELWHCRHCHKNQPAMPTKNGKAKVVAFRTGFVGVQLICRHWAAVRQDKVQ